MNNDCYIVTGNSVRDTRHYLGKRKILNK